MLKTLKKEENLIMIFFVLALVSLIVIIFVKRNLIDVIYLGVLLLYFWKFLIIKNR